MNDFNEMIPLKYGCNPHQAHAAVEVPDGANSPLELLNGTPSLINVLDALNGWQLVKEARNAIGLPAAASFKHVSPAGAAVALPLNDELARAYEVLGIDLTPTATAYVRARGTDPKSSFGDFVALSETVDVPTARFLKGVISDGIIAPGFDPEALEILKSKKQGTFIVIKADDCFVPPKTERRETFGLALVQDRNDHIISAADLQDVVCGSLNPEAVRDLVLGLVVVKYTQSNSVCYVRAGQTIGIGAGQQSRVDCTKLAGAKADLWWLGMHPKVLGLHFRPHVKRQERINWRVRYIEGDLTRYETKALEDALEVHVEQLQLEERKSWLKKLEDVALISDGFIPFRDNIDHASQHGVRFIAEPGGSSRSGDVKMACEEYGITLVHSHLRLFHH
jgi:phosphoribosylaminoimidazolecarboxamide formyltransferase/IMP cyclohydrolase